VKKPMWTEKHDDVREAIDNVRALLGDMPVGQERYLAEIKLDECDLWLERITVDPGEVDPIGNALKLVQNGDADGPVES